MSDDDAKMGTAKETFEARKHAKHVAQEELRAAINDYSRARQEFSRPGLTIEQARKSRELLHETKESLRRAQDNFRRAAVDDAKWYWPALENPIRDERTRTPIIKPPLFWIRDWATVVAGKTFVRDILEPELADIQHEYFEAMVRGYDRKAKLITVLGGLRLAAMLVVSPITRLMSSIRSIT